MIDKNKIKHRFSKNAKQYDKYANVQKKMGNILIDNIVENYAKKHTISNILEIGCGTGYVTSQLINQFPTAHITAIDIAPGMIEHTRNILKSPTVDFICADIEHYQLLDKYDLIISNATFQWFNDFSSTLLKLSNALTDNGILCFSTFGDETFNELHKCYEEASVALSVDKKITPGQSFFSLDELDYTCNKALDQCSEKYHICGEDNYEYEFFPHCKDFFYSIKKIGANNSNTSNLCISPSFMKKVINIYNNRFSSNKGIMATYHCLFMNIVKSNKINDIKG